MQIRTVTQSKLTSECWPVQVWGLDSCKSCEFKNTKDCGGEHIVKTGKNNKGFIIPIGYEN